MKIDEASRQASARGRPLQLRAAGAIPPRVTRLEQAAWLTRCPAPTAGTLPDVRSR